MLAGPGCAGVAVSHLGWATPGMAQLWKEARERPFRTGFVLSLGAAGAVLLGRALLAAAGVLVLVVLGVVLAAGIEPLVLALQRRLRLARRGAAVVAMLLVGAGVAVVLVVLVAPAARGLTGLLSRLPVLAEQAQNGHGAAADLARRLMLQQRAADLVTRVVTPEGALRVSGGLFTVARTAFTLTFAAVALGVVVVRLTLDFPRAKRAAYRLVPRSRRARVTLLADAALVRVGSYLLGNVFTSVVAGTAMWVFLLVVGVPHAAALGLLVGVADLVPLVGALAGGAVVALVALSISPGVALATVVFTVVFRQLEDYLLIPRVMAKAVDVAPLLSVVSTLIGGALLGIAGALLAVPVAACAQLLVQEVALPRQEAS